MATLQKISPCLWFDSQAEEAAQFYVDIFENSRIVQVTRYSEAGFEQHGRAAGSVMVVAFELDGQLFTALNGGPEFRFSEAISLQVYCADQGEIDHFWDRLGAGGDPGAQQCGWLKDRYGLSWQVVPRNMGELFEHENEAGTKRAMNAFMRMKKIDIEAVERAKFSED